MSSAAAQPAPLPAADLVPLERVRNHLAGLWFVGAVLIVGIVVLQSLLGKYGDRTENVWEWLLPTIMPTIGMIISVLGYSALDATASRFTVKRSFYRIAVYLSVFYQFLVLLTILIQPLVGTDPLELMHTSNLWLGPIQGVVASALGVLFVSSKPKGSAREQPGEA
jgi:hypothetical protein